MPFISPSSRDAIAKDGPSAAKEVGDLAFLFYREIMRIWREEPRWRTVSRIRRLYLLEPEQSEFFNLVYDKVMHKFELEEVVNQAGLAYEVFFAFYGLPYELDKRAVNGDI